jgi:hypothetical protein
MKTTSALHRVKGAEVAPPLISRCAAHSTGRRSGLNTAAHRRCDGPCAGLDPGDHCGPSRKRGQAGLPRRAGTRPPRGGRNLRRLEELLGGLGTAEGRTSWLTSAGAVSDLGIQAGGRTGSRTAGFSACFPCGDGKVSPFTTLTRWAYWRSTHAR